MHLAMTPVPLCRHVNQVGDAACVRLWSLLVAAAVARHRDTVFSNTGARVFADQIRRVGCVARHWT